MVLALVLYLHAIETCINLIIMRYGTEIIAKFSKDVQNVSDGIIVLLLCVWAGIGSYWLWSGSGCDSDWGAGYLTTYIAVLTLLAVLGLSICLGFIGGIFVCIGRGLTQRADYKPV
jgi:hypothetical protein